MIRKTRVYLKNILDDNTVFNSNIQEFEYIPIPRFLILEYNLTYQEALLFAIIRYFEKHHSPRYPGCSLSNADFIDLLFKNIGERTIITLLGNLYTKGLIKKSTEYTKRVLNTIL